MRKLIVIFMALLLLLPAMFVIAGGQTEKEEGKAEKKEEYLEVAPGVKRSETLMVDQIFRYPQGKNYNFWIPGTSTPTRQAYIHETLWYIDQQTGKWIDAVAAKKPEYSDDFKTMTVTIRKGLKWSDGEDLDANDIVFTVKTLQANPGMLWSGEFKSYVENVSSPDNHTVVFKLSRPYPRFHNFFTSRYNACYIMPEHVWKDVEDPMSYTYYPPVAAGPYVTRDIDPNGYWELFELRDDWKDTPLGKVTESGNPPPKYLLTVFYGASEKKVMAMTQHKLDVFMNVVPEAFESLLEKDKYAECWYEDFPWAWQDELDCRFFMFNHAVAPYNNKDVRWALALALDVVGLQTEYLAGIPRVAALPQPPTPFHMEAYYKPLQDWLENFELEIEDGTSWKPYDTTVPEQIAAWARQQGHDITGDPVGMFGYGWWKHAPDVAERLLKKHGFSRDSNGSWLLPDGSPWEIDILVTPDEVDVHRLALGAVEQWGDFGIDVEINAIEREPYYAHQNLGQYEISSSWGFSGGIGASAIIDKWPFIQQLHSNFYKPIGENSTNAAARIKSDDLDNIIEDMGKYAPDDSQVRELGMEFMKYWVREMNTITTLGFKKYVTHDDYYWTHFPGAEDPYGQPCYWFMGGKFVLPYLKKVE